MYRGIIIKRFLEDIFISPFILLGRIIAAMAPLENEYRIFYFFPFYHTGGAEKVHAQIAAATGGKDCIIFFTKRSADDRFLEDFKKTGCEIKVISKFTDKKWLYFLNLIYRGIITGYINSQKQLPIIFNGQCNFGYKISPWVKSNIPQVELIHSLNTFSFIRIPFLPFITKTVMISRKRIEDHKEQYKQYNIPASFAERIQYIPNAINLPEHVPPKSDNDLVVLYVGRATEEKRVEIIAQITNELRNDNAQFIKFEMLGDVTAAIDKEVYPFIKLYGNLNDERLISEIYDRSHVLILTSTTEGFPMVIMEAMAHGCVILSTAVGDIPFHIKNKENGFLFSKTDDEAAIINEASEKILWLKNNGDEMNKISKNNINYANHNFGIERFNKDYRDLLSSVNEKN